MNTVTLNTYTVHVIYRFNQAEYSIRIRVVAPQEYVNIYSTSRVRIAVRGSFERHTFSLVLSALFLTRVDSDS